MSAVSKNSSSVKITAFAALSRMVTVQVALLGMDRSASRLLLGCNASGKPALIFRLCDILLPFLDTSSIAFSIFTIAPWR